MAAGEGIRMRPLTERYAKPVLPIDGRPVIATLLHELAAAGFARATVVTGHLAEQVEALAGRPGAFGLEIRFVRQPGPTGSADAVSCALAAGAPLPCLVTAADTVFVPGDVGRFVAAFGDNGSAGAIAVRRDPAPDPPHRWPIRVRDGLVERVLDDDRANPLTGAPLWVVGRDVAACLCLDAAPYELSNAFQRAIDGGETIRGIEISRTRDLTRPIDLVQENFIYLGSM
ncbi:MAG: nucleotidyltransferase family protein [Gaiellaceae bacterium]